MNYKLGWILGASAVGLALWLGRADPPQPPPPPLAGVAPLNAPAVRPPVAVPAFAPDYAGDRRQGPAPTGATAARPAPAPAAVPLLAIGEGDAPAQERILKQMMRDYEQVRPYPEQRQAHRDEMAARLEAYSERIAPIALAQAAAHRARQQRAGGQ